MRHRWMDRTAAAAGAVGAVATVAVLAGNARWQRDTGRTVTRLMEGAGGPAAAAGPASADALPPPVARYFAYAVPDGAAEIRTAQVDWSGEFRMRPGGGWSPFTAEQAFTARPAAFVWDARIRMMPAVTVRVRDNYAAGSASMLGRVAGVLPVVNEGGTPEIAQSALARWLGEAVWFPTALRPYRNERGSLQWEAVDDGTARATLTDGTVSVTAEFSFGPGGEIARMSALRFRDVDGTNALTPFEGEYHDYVRCGGFMVPQRAEVAWLLPEGRFAYWRGKVEGIRYTGDASARIPSCAPAPVPEASR